MQRCATHNKNAKTAGVAADCRASYTAKLGCTAATDWDTSLIGLGHAERVGSAWQARR
jgi:hypothetical protein